MKSNTLSTISLVFVLMAAASLVSMISSLRIDGIVHGDLYRYGLQFSYAWAMPYWTFATLVFVMGWFNIIVATAFQFYVLVYGRKETLQPETSKEPEPQLQQQPQPAKEKTVEMETKPTEKVEEYKEQETKSAEQVEKELEKSTVVEDTSQREQLETTQAEEVEGQKEQESKVAEESKTETKETSTTTTETEQETPEKSEEEPILVSVPEEEPQVGTSPL